MDSITTKLDEQQYNQWEKDFDRNYGMNWDSKR